MRAFLAAALLSLVAVVLPLPSPSAAARAGEATVSGTVLAEGGGRTTTHTTVTVQHRVDGEWRWVGLDGGTAFTDHLGRYQVTVPAGSYRLHFEQLDHLEQHVPISLAAGEQRTLDVVLDRGAAITGTVTAPAGGPSADAFVRVYARVEAGPNSFWSQVDHAYVEPSGAWSASGFPGGTYRVGVDPVQDHYPDEFYDNVTAVEDAVDITVADDGTVGGIHFDLGTAPVTPPRQVRAVTTSREPRLKGRPKVGKRLKVALGTVTPTTASVRYKWFVGARKVRGASRPALRLTRRMAGKRVKVTVVARAPEHTTLRTTLRTNRKVRASAGPRPPR